MNVNLKYLIILRVWRFFFSNLYADLSQFSTMNKEKYESLT